MQETWVWSLGREEPLEKGLSTHSNILAWRIPWTEDPGSLQSMGHKESDWTEWLTHTQAPSCKAAYVSSMDYVRVSQAPIVCSPTLCWGQSSRVSHTLCSFLSSYLDFPGDSVIKSLSADAGEMGFNPCIWTIPWRRKWQPAPVFCLGNFVGRGVWQATVHGVKKESDTT